MELDARLMRASQGGLDLNTLLDLSVSQKLRYLSLFGRMIAEEQEQLFNAIHGGVR